MEHTQHTRTYLQFQSLITVNAVYTLLRWLSLLVFCRRLTEGRPTGLCILLGSSDKLGIELKLMINLLEGMHISEVRLHFKHEGISEVSNWLQVVSDIPLSTAA